MKLQTKILLLLIPLIVTPLTTIGFIAYYQLQDNLQQNRLNEMRLVLNQVNSEFSAHLKTAIANIELFSTSFLVEKYALTTDESERYGLLQRPLLSLLANYQRAYPSYYEIRYLLSDGYESARRSTKSINNITEDESNDDFIRSLYNGSREAKTAIRINPDNKELALYIGKALYLRDDSFDPLRAPEILRGSLVITDNLLNLQNSVSHLDFGSTGKLALISRNGNAYFTDEDDPIFYALDTNNLPQDLISQLYSAINSSITLKFGNDLYHVSSIEIYPDLLLFAALPDEELHSVTDKLATWVFSITVITIIVFASLVFASLRFLVIRPLQSLNRASSAIAKGNMDVEVNVPGNDEIAHLAKSFSNMAKSLTESHAQVKYMAHHDALTGLPNRHMFKEYFTRSLAHAKRHNESMALMFLDIDEFKHVNDTLGHEAGDRLLEKISERLTIALRECDFISPPDKPIDNIPYDMIARIGGDEFTLILSDIKHPEQASVAAERILDVLKPAFVINKHKFYIGGSIGITLFPQDGQNVDELVKNADLAMYQAKHSGKNTYKFFKPEMNTLVLHRVNMAARIRQAIENNDFVLHYQPLIDIKAGKITGLEALIRWQDRDSGELISPNNFIPLAEETGLIIPIGEWVLKETCRQIRTWIDNGLPTVPVSVNASSIQLSGQNLSTMIQSTLDQCNLPADLLEIELTESSVMSAAGKAVNNLRKIKELGVSIALDDFGTGYSSLSHLRDFAIDKLKIDRSFIIEIGQRSTQRSLIAAIIAMAHTLGLKVVAEGIEDHDQLQFLTDHHCDIAQGFLFSKPLPADQIEHLLIKNIKNPYKFETEHSLQ